MHPGEHAKRFPDEPAVVMADGGTVLMVQPVSMADAGSELEQELLEWSRSQLSAIKCPRSVDFEAELPRHPTGKLYKRLLRDRYWKGHESRIL